MNANNIIKIFNLRKTKLRLSLIEIFESKKKVMNYKDICFDLAIMSLSPNKSTIYREIETLTNVGYLRCIASPGGYNVYEKKSKIHPHFVCKNCNKITCLDLGLDEFQQILANKKIIWEEIKLEICGICQSCKSKIK
jgi:Fe2+ or Zn2+ uptake regulation protein